MATTVKQMVGAAKGRIRNLTPQELADSLRSSETLIVDLREAAELDDEGMIPGAVHVPRGLLEFLADTESPLHRAEFHPERRTILYCAVGSRSALAVGSLQALGYRDVSHLDGGFEAWEQADFPAAPRTAG